MKSGKGPVVAGALGLLLLPLPGAASPPPDRMETTVVTGTGSAERLVDSPVRIEVVTPADFQTVQAVKLSDALEYAPGLRLENNCQTCNTTEIRLLGLPQRYVAILHDGVPNFSGLAGVYGLEQIPAALVGQVEVVKGGGSTLYGPGAVAGVVNLIPRTPDRSGASLDTLWSFPQGANTTREPNIDLVGVADLVETRANLSLTAHGLYSVVQAVDVNGDGYSEVARRRLGTGGARGVWRPAAGIRLVFDYLGSDEERRGGSLAQGALDAPPNTVGLAEELFSRRHAGLLTWEHHLSADWEYRLTGSVTSARRDSYYGGTGPLGGPADPDWDPTLPPAAEAPRGPDGSPLPPYNVDWSPSLGFGETENRLAFGDGLLTWHGWDGHALSAGLQYRHETLQDAASYRVFSDSYQNLGVLLQDRWDASARWELVYGVRVDSHNLLPSPVVSPRAAALWRATGDFRVRGSASTGFRPPELFDEDLHISNVGGDLQVVTRSPDLREESSLSFSLGPEWQITPRWYAEINGFHTRIRDTFFNQLAPAQDEPGIQQRTKSNAGAAQVSGAEFNLAWRPSPAWTLELNYVEQRSRFDAPQLLLGDPTGADPVDNPVFSRPFARTPDRYGFARLIVDPGWARFFVGSRATGPMLVPRMRNDPIEAGSPLEGSYPGQPRRLGNSLEESPWFFVLDLSVARTWKLAKRTDLTLTTGCRNVLNAFQDDLDRGKYRDAAYVYGPRFPRTLFASVTVRF